MFLAFSYFYREPKNLLVDLEFPKYDFKLSSLIIHGYFSGWVEHGVRKLKIKDSDYYDGWEDGAITSFLVAEIIKNEGIS